MTHDQPPLNRTFVKHYMHYPSGLKLNRLNCMPPLQGYTYVGLVDESNILHTPSCGSNENSFMHCNSSCDISDLCTLKI